MNTILNLYKFEKLEVRWLFSFCFPFTELQLETVRKAFHITRKYVQLCQLK